MTNEEEFTEEENDLAQYAEPGSKAEFLAKREAWFRGELAQEDLPEGAISIDGLGRKLAFGKYLPKRGADVDTGIKRTPKAMGTSISPKWVPTLDRPLPSVRCVTIKKNGERCGRWSIRGATVCISHGGRLPSIKKHAAAQVETARMRLIDLTDEAVEVLADLTTNANTADAVRLKAAGEILDRAGIKGALEISVEVEHKIDPSVTIAERLKEIANRQSKEDIVDAEVLEEV